MRCVGAIATPRISHEDRIAERPLLGDETTAASDPLRNLERSALSLSTRQRLTIGLGEKGTVSFSARDCQMQIFEEIF